MHTLPTAPSSRVRRLGLLLVLTLALLLRLWQIGAIPPGFHFDESFEGLEAWRILTQPGYRPVFLTGNFGVPPLNAYVNAVTFGLFTLFGAEAGPLAMRTTAALFGTLGVLAVYLLAVELRNAAPSGRRPGPLFPLFAAASLALMRWHIHFSRMGIEPVIVPVIWAGAFWLLLRGRRTGARRAFIGLGILLAAAMYTYQGAWVIPLLVAVSAGVFVVTEKSADGQVTASSVETDPRPLRRNLFLAAAISLLLVLPLARFFVNHPDLLLLRPAQLTVIGETGSPADGGVWRSVFNTFKMFWPFGMGGDLDPRRNLPGAPALNLWQAIPFFLGLSIALRHLRRRTSWIVLLGWGGLLLPGMVSEYAPHFHRILGAAAPTALLCAFGLDAIWRFRPLRQMSLHLLALLLIVAGGWQSARTYFVEWAALPDLYYAFDAGLWEIGQWADDQKTGNPVYVSPRGAEHATLAFAWRPRTEKGETAVSSPIVVYDGRHIFPLRAGVNAQDEHYLTIEHEDFRTRLLLPEMFPAARVETQFHDAGGAVYATLFTRAANEAPARAPQYPTDLLLGDGIALIGYDTLPANPQAGQILYLQLHWQTVDAPQQDWIVFTHVADRRNGQVVAGHDSRPGNGSLTTVRWQSGWRILDEYQIALPPDLAPAEYELRVGLYQPQGARMPAEKAGVLLGSIHVE